MSFGASPSDIIIVVTFARRLYKQCRNAGGEYLEISREVRGLHTVLRHLKSEVEAEDSILNRDRALYARELAPVIGDCDFTLRELDEVLQKYGRLASHEGSSVGRLWDKIRFGSNELDDLGSIRMKLINHKTSITVFIDTVQLHEAGRMSHVLDKNHVQLDMILDKVDNIAVRMGQQARSIMTTYEDDDKEVWKQFRRELIEEGFSSDILQQHKDVLRAYIREIDQNGVLVDEIPEPQSASSAGMNPEQWLEGVPAPARTSQLPPAFASLHVNSEDTSTKERVTSEENMKFPQSIKSERAKPETGPSGFSSGTGTVDSKKQVISQEDRHVEPKERKDDPQSALPKLATIVAESRLPTTAYSTAIMSTSDVIAHSGSRSDRPANEKRPTSPEEEYETNYTPSSSPTDSNNPSSSIDERVPRSMGPRPRTTLAPEPSWNGTSPSQYGTSPSSNRNLYSSSPRSSTLSPDSQGKPIPLDAKWTRVKRELISPEVLAQDQRRYEATPDFVAVLGVLSREEIADYAARSAVIREARRAHQGAQPPPRPPRPTEEPRWRHVSFDASNAGNHSPEYSDDERDRRTSPARERRSYPSPNPPFHPGPSNYANASPTRDHFPHSYPQFQPSPQPRAYQQFASPPPHGVATGSPYNNPSPLWIPSPAASPHPQYHAPVGIPATSRNSRGNSSSRTVERNLELEREKKKRWTSNLTAAGIGGGVVSLLTVLSEAAENL